MDSTPNASQDRICGEYRNFVQWVINTYFPLFRFDEDFFQEGWIGLWEATQDFDESRGVKFKTFATVVIKRRCFDELKRRRRYAKLPTVSLNKELPDGRMPLIDTLTDERDLVGDIIGDICAEQLLHDLKASGLSQKQLNIMSYRVEGQTLKQISENIGMHTSTIHDGLKTVRRVAKKVLENY